MENRKFHRYEAAVVLKSMASARLVLPDRREISVTVENICYQGLKAVASAPDSDLALPRTRETVDLVLTDPAVTVTCRCIYTLYTNDGSLNFGLFAFREEDQAQLQSLVDSLE